MLEDAWQTNCMLHKDYLYTIFIRSTYSYTLDIHTMYV